MTSRRSIMLSVVLGAFLSIMALGTANAQVPRSISYQGLLMKNGAPVNAVSNFKINIHDAAGTVLYTESFNQVSVANGIFNVVIGSSSPLPGNLKFDQQYFLGVEVDGTGEIQPYTPFSAAPYALNAQTVGGIAVSSTPQAGMLLPLGSDGKFPASVLPQSTQTLGKINGMDGGVNGDVEIVGSAPIVIVTDAVNNTITIKDTATAGGVQAVVAGPGLSGGGVGPVVTLAIANNGITPGMIGTGAVTGRNLDQAIAANGLFMDQLGDLNVGHDATLLYTSSGNGTGNAPALHNIGLNLANPNTWTALQTFAAGINASFASIGTLGTNGNYLTVNGLAEPLAGNNAAAAYEIIDNGDLKVTGSTTIIGNTFIGSGTNGGTNTMGTVGQSANTVQGLTNTVSASNAASITTATNNTITAVTSGTGAASNTINASGGATANINNITASGGAGSANNIQAPANNIGTTQASGNTNQIGTAGNSVNTITGSTNTVTGTVANNSQAPTVNIGTTQAAGNTINIGTAALTTTTINGLNNNITASSTNTITGTTNNVNGTTNINGNTTVTGSLTQSGGNATINGGTTNVFSSVANATNTIGSGAASTNTIGAAGSSTNTITGANNTMTATGTNTINGTTNVNGNTSVVGTFSSTGNSNVATAGGTVNTFGSGAGSTNTIGNAGTSANTMTGVTNVITGSVSNTINGPTTINGNTQINGTLGNTGNLNLGTASTTNNYGGATSANRFNGTSNFGTIPASNGNKVIIDGLPNTNPPVGPSGVPTGFVTPTDFEVNDNGDLQVTGWSNLANATVGNLWVNSSFTLAPAATFCANTVQTNTLTYWCGGPVGAAINLNTALSQGSLGTSAANTFLATNFNGNVTITGVTTHTGNIVQNSGTAQFLNTQINGTLGSTGNLSLGTTSTTNTIGAAGATNTLVGATNNLNATNNNFNGTMNQAGNSNFTGGTSTFNANNISLINGSNIVGNNTNTNISNIVNTQTQTVTIGSTPLQQTTISATNSTGAPINQQLASVPGKIPVYNRAQGTLNPGTPGPNGGASVTLNFGAGTFDNNDAIIVTYYTRAGNQFGSIYPSNINVLAGTIQVESTNPNDANIIQVTILRD